MDSSVTANLVREAYEHMKEEIRASHLLIGLPKEANPEDTLKAYQQAQALRDQLMSGGDFATLARNHSQDPSAQSNGGDLGYFTALQMVYPFEKAAYQTKTGEISQPVRTTFGYHLIKVADRRPSRGKAQAAHIMVRTNPEVSAEDAKAAKQKIDEIYQRLLKGEAWDKLASQFSEDGSSRNKGGVLPPFGTGNMIPAFEDAAFALRKPGDISAPVLTPYGWHIIKLIEKKELEPLEELEQTLRQRVNKDSRSELNRTLFLQRLRRENNLTEDASARNFAFSKITDSLRFGKWNYVPEKSLGRTLFTIGKENYPITGFFEYVKGQQEAKPTISPAYYAQLLYNSYVDQSLWEYEKTHLEEKYPDYRFLVKEYRDGILLFQRMEDQVWSKSLSDSTGQRAFFENNRSNYQWGRRVKATVYNAADASVLAELKEILKKPNFPVNNPSFAELNFDKNKTATDSGQQDQLGKLARAMQQDKSLLVEITGFADPRETEVISGKRARTVSDYLTANGIDLTRIIIRDAGRFKPVSKTNLRQNARVTFALYSTDKDAIERNFNSRKPLSLEITEGFFQKGDNEIVDKVNWQKGSHQLDYGGRKYYVEITAVEEPRPRTFEESRGATISDFQAYLEKQWLETLRRRYPVVVNEQEVQAIIR
jgi:peptidyl-prolyl cis-trans isomerase SurA